MGKLIKCIYREYIFQIAYEPLTHELHSSNDLKSQKLKLVFVHMQYWGRRYSERSIGFVINILTSELLTFIVHVTKDICRY